MLLKRKDIDATQGPILKNFITFAVPIAIGGIIQTLFNAADMAVLGNFGSSLGVAAVGATANIISFLVNTFIGLAGGSSGPHLFHSNVSFAKLGHRPKAATVPEQLFFTCCS